MVKIEVCIGSACYVKGSNQVVTLLQNLVKENGWENSVEIKGSFCMQSCQCGHGLGIRINDRQLSGVGLHNVEEVLKQEISDALS